MRKTTDILYDAAKAYVKNKDTAIQHFIQTSLDRTQQIFSYAGLPDTMPQYELENILQRNGHALIAKVDGELYAFAGSFGGEPDVYNRPTQYIVNNPALQHNKTYTIGKECVLIKNDFHMVGMLPLIQKYGVLMLDTEISLNTVSVLSRITMLISAPDDRTKANADLFVKKILDGDFSVIGSNAFFEGLQMLTSSTTNGNIVNQLIELMQYYRGTFYNELGLQAPYNMKREHLSSEEVAMNIDTLLPLVENMYNERVRAIAAVNEMFGTEIVIDYNGAWKATQEHADKEETTFDTDSTAPIEEVVQEMEKAAIHAIEAPVSDSKMLEGKDTAGGVKASGEGENDTIDTEATNGEPNEEGTTALTVETLPDGTNKQDHALEPHSRKEMNDTDTETTNGEADKEAVEESAVEKMPNSRNKPDHEPKRNSRKGGKDDEESERDS